MAAWKTVVICMAMFCMFLLSSLRVKFQVSKKQLFMDTKKEESNIYPPYKYYIGRNNKSSEYIEEDDAQLQTKVGKIKNYKLKMVNEDLAMKNDAYINEKLRKKKAVKLENATEIARYFAVDVSQSLLSILKNIYTERLFWEPPKGTETVRRNSEISLCEKGYFRIHNRNTCRKIATCEDINQRLNILREITHGTGKTIFEATMDGMKVAVAMVHFNSPQNEYEKAVASRAISGLENLVALQDNPYVTPVFGHCYNYNNSTSLVVLEGCFKYLSLRMLARAPYNLSIRTRMKMAIQLIASIHYLQTAGKHPRVLCDLHNPRQSLGQFLLSDHGTVYLTDLDEIPEVDKDNNKFAHCRTENHAVIEHPYFIPPEQRYTSREYENKTHEKPVTEKSDIWKIPFLTNILLFQANPRLNEDEIKLQNDLQNIHKECHNENPLKRPNITTVLTEYLKIFKQNYEPFNTI